MTPVSGRHTAEASPTGEFSGRFRGEIAGRAALNSLRFRQGRGAAGRGSGKSAALSAAPSPRLPSVRRQFGRNRPIAATSETNRRDQAAVIGLALVGVRAGGNRNRAGSARRCMPASNSAATPTAARSRCTGRSPEVEQVFPVGAVHARTGQWAVIPRPRNRSKNTGRPRRRGG